MSFVRKTESVAGNSRFVSSEDPAMKATLPALHDYLTLESYDDGSPRQKATLTIFREDGLWKGCLNEKDQGLVLFVAEDSVQSVMEALELLLQEDHPPWRKSNPKGARGPKKGQAGA